MILRHATPADAADLRALASASWTRLGIPFDPDIPILQRLQHNGARVVLLHQDGPIVAALAGHPIETDRGPGYHVTVLLVHPDHPDKLRALDALSLYACNLALADGRPRIFTERRPGLRALHYGRDLLGMTNERLGNAIHQYGDARAIARGILRRRPKWRM